ncbi:MAG: TM1812 family CRISPR-associated protein [Clostridiales Family XIII bacterium]|jgi:hypothetical protein|nr:TM1812 family CRISPR-associated protein [Clostridiales Family XIII bacterium]
MSKIKTFIATIPFQGKDGRGNDLLTPVTYAPAGNTKLAYGETRFPIIPVMNGYAERGDKIRVLAILTDGENFRHNHETYFVPEISALAKEKAYDFSGVEVISVPDDESIDAQLKLFADIIAKIGDGEETFACITYGTKPTPIVQTMALNYAYKLKKDVSVGCVVYGRFMHKSGDGRGVGTIYDTTALFYMDGIVNRLAEMKAANPEKAIRALLELGDGDE